MEQEIECVFVNPPIPIRCKDWVAWMSDEPEGLYGWGATRREAMNDLNEQLADRQLQVQAKLAEQQRARRRESVGQLVKRSLAVMNRTAAQFDGEIDPV